MSFITQNKFFQCDTMILYHNFDILSDSYCKIHDIKDLILLSIHLIGKDRL